MKRIIIATLCGLLFGFVCFFMANANSEMPLGVSLQIIASRTLMGFAIGISSLNLKHWAWHGIILGFIFSLPMAFSVLAAPESPDFNPMQVFYGTLIMGIVYGFLTELITSVAFKAKQ